MAGIESQIIWVMVYGLYGLVPLVRDEGLFAIGDLAFSICVVFINIKLLYGRSPSSLSSSTSHFHLNTDAPS